MSSAPFEMTVSVLPDDIDEQNHVNNTVYLRWVQDVATAHWRVLASPEAQASIGWVVLRHEIDYNAPACFGDEIVLRTWVGEATRLTFERFTEIRRRTVGQLLSKARTLWCPINAQTGRPVRVPPHVREQFSTSLRIQRAAAFQPPTGVALEVEHWAFSVERSALEIQSSNSRPIVACYCATFLKPEMLHIYRQITAMERFAPVVIAQKREETERFPFEPVHILPKPGTHFLRRFWFRQVRDIPWQISGAERRALLDVLNKNHAQLLHIYFGQIAVHLLPLIRAWPNPTIVSFHGADVMVDMNKPAYREATRQMLHAVKLVLVRSESLRRAVAQLGCDPNKIEIQRTGIPLEEFPFRERSFPRNGEWRFVQAGRLMEKKGLPVTLRAFAAFLRHYPNATLTVAGEGPLLGELEKLARELNVQRHVSFTGFVSQQELRDIYCRSHIFLHPSQIGSDGNQEGIPNSMLEAMATGLPVFATNHGGIPEVIENGVSGVLVPEQEHEALAQALLAAVKDSGFLPRIARSGADVVRNNFDLRARARGLEEIYFRLL